MAAPIPVTNWAVIVDGGGATTITDGTTNSPTFAPADQDQVAGGFDTVTLSNDGDFITGKATLTLDRTSAGGMGDNLRFALFREAGGGNPTAGDAQGYTGFSFALQHSLREHFDPDRASPFSSGGAGAPVVVLNPAGQDPEGDTIGGETVTLHFTMTIARDGNALDISGTITDGGAYTQSFSVNDHMPNTTETSDVYSWNRMGFLFANAVNGNSASLINARIIIPEPATAMLLLLGMVGLLSARGVRAQIRSPQANA